jgi:LacI family transcriptional regulator
VLNGRADELRSRPETQQRVREAVVKLGYRPNASTRAMQSGRFGSAALIQSAHRIFLPSSLLLGLSEELNRRPMRLMVAESADAEISEAVYLPNVMRELSVDGLLVNVLLDVPPELLDKIHVLRVPEVWINADGPADCVFPDDFRSGVQATEHLLKLGHKRIAFVCPTDPAYSDEKKHYSVRAKRVTRA